ncbi:MAG TPA: response regulator transcription factor [Kiritimatiellia bacterium]|nr:response regulator transcription factor [Kiritimatiellia bacterium]
MRILVVEDNRDLAANIGDYLEGKGHTVDFAVDGVAGLRLAVTQTHDVIVLDIMLPGMDGLDLCRKLRSEAKFHTPVLLLTAKDTLDDKLDGFDAGADDYVVKPFALKELEARLKALARRTKHERSGVLDCGSLRVDTGQRLVTKNGGVVTLNRSCYRILVELMSRMPDVVRREDLEHRLWGDMRPGSDALRSHVYALRRALGESGEGSLIETVHGVGFRMRNAP